VKLRPCSPAKVGSQLKNNTGVAKTPHATLRGSQGGVRCASRIPAPTGRPASLRSDATRKDDCMHSALYGAAGQSTSVIYSLVSKPGQLGEALRFAGIAGDHFSHQNATRGEGSPVGETLYPSTADTVPSPSATTRPPPSSRPTRRSSLAELLLSISPAA
jgi:hypothetical protein